MQILFATLALGSTNIETALCLSTDPEMISECIRTNFGETRFIEQDIRDGILIKMKDKKCWIYIRYIWMPDTDEIPDTAYIIYNVNRRKDDPYKTEYHINHVLFSKEKCDEIIRMKRIDEPSYDYRLKNKCGIVSLRGKQNGWRSREHECNYVIQSVKILKKGITLSDTKEKV